MAELALRISVQDVSSGIASVRAAVRRLRWEVTHEDPDGRFTVKRSAIDAVTIEVASGDGAVLLNGHALSLGDSVIKERLEQLRQAAFEPVRDAAFVDVRTPAGGIGGGIGGGMPPGSGRAAVAEHPEPGEITRKAQEEASDIQDALDEAAKERLRRSIREQILALNTRAAHASATEQESIAARIHQLRIELQRLE